MSESNGESTVRMNQSPKYPKGTRCVYTPEDHKDRHHSANISGSRFVPEIGFLYTIAIQDRVGSRLGRGGRILFGIKETELELDAAYEFGANSI